MNGNRFALNLIIHGSPYLIRSPFLSALTAIEDGRAAKEFVSPFAADHHAHSVPASADAGTDAAQTGAARFDVPLHVLCRVLCASAGAVSAHEQQASQ